MADAEVTRTQIPRSSAWDARWRSALGLARRHLALVAVLGAAVILRVLALVAVYPGIWFSDANSYLQVATTGRLSIVRVEGYALFVAPFLHLGSAAALIVVQHLLGLAIVVLLYALLLRRGVPQWLAVLAVLPAALDAYLIALEHMIMSETVFHIAVVGSLALLLWREQPTIVEAGLGGLLVGYASVTRSVALPFIALFLAYLLVRRVGLYRLLAFALAWAVVLGTYMTIFRVQHGELALTEWSGHFLYAKVAPFGRCDRLGHVPADEQRYCPERAARHYDSNGYLWGKGSPIHGAAVSEDARIRDFALRVVRAHPLTYVKAVARDTIHYFEPAHRTGFNDYSATAWEFPRDPRVWHYPGYRGPIRPGSRERVHDIDPSQYVNPMVGKPSLNVTASKLLHYYQRFVYASGQLLLLALVLVGVALLRRRRPAFRLRLDATLIALSCLCALVVASMLSIFDFRYGLLAVILLPVAGALAATATWGRPPPVE